VVKVPKAKHRLKPGGAHTGKGIENWNGAWKAFFDGFKNGAKPTREQILEQLAKMRRAFGI
jgi:hypothetical protein